MDIEKGVWKASGVFAPTYPRQSSDHRTMQDRRANRRDFCNSLVQASKNEMPGYYSVYSFPRGHSRSGNIPDVDCIFIDLDVEGGDYNPNEGRTKFDAWRRDMSALLTRARMIARTILDAGKEEHYRVTLSGHKGLHIYLDFPTIAPSNGSFEKFKAGLKEYGERVIRWLDTTSGGVNIDPWVDVDASDLGRLARHPNTIHHGAVYDDTERWCVPVTMDELASLRVEDYLRLTREPRWPDGYERNPSESAGEKATQAIRTASVSPSAPSRNNTSRPNPENVEQYEANEDIEAEDIPFLTSNYPCIQAFLERDDAWNYGNASHLMEVNVVGKLIRLNVPRDVIHEVFAEIPGYSEGKTDEVINDVLEREYNSFNCAKLASRAETFCLGSDCSVYRRNDDIQK